MRLTSSSRPLRFYLPLALMPLVFVLSACLVRNGAAELTPKAIFIIVDGIPADVLESAPTPSIDRIAEAGAYARAYVGGEVGGSSQSPTVSAVGYNSLLTGTWANKHNVYTNAIEAPNYQYWDIFRLAKNHDPELQTAVFSTWEDNRTKLIGDGLLEAGGNKLDYFLDGLENDQQRFPHDDDSLYIKAIDVLVSNEAARHVREVGPDLSWVYLQYTDDIGHRFGDSNELSAAVRFMDANVGAIWQAVNSRQMTEQEDWLLVVTTDHGRDSETGKRHGGQSARERTIWIATNSTRLNARFTATPAIVDILPSLTTHLGIQIPEAIGQQLDGQSFIKGK